MSKDTGFKEWGMELIKQQEGLLRQPPVPNAPTVEVVLGGVPGDA